MRVNQGKISFGSFDDDGNCINAPDKTWPLKDLMREALEHDIIEDEKSKTHVKKHVSKNVIENTLKKIFLETGQSYVVETKYSDDAAIDLNPFKDQEEQYQANNKFISDISVSDKLMKSVMTAISLNTNVIYRKVLIMYLMYSGLQIKNAKTFVLETDFTDYETSDYTEAELEELSEQNKEINAVIKSFQDRYVNEYDSIVTRLIEEASKFATEEHRHELQSMIAVNADKFLIAPVGNLWRDVYGDGDRYSGWKASDGEPLLIPSTQKAFNTLLTGTRYSGLRAEVENLIKIPYKDSKPALGITQSQWTNNNYKAIKWLQSVIC